MSSHPPDPPAAKKKSHPGKATSKACPAIKAAQEGHLQALQGLPAEEVLNASDHNGCSCFHWAAGNGHLQLCDFLLDLRAALEGTTWNQRTALHYAARNGQTEVCQWLVTKRAEPFALARDEVSPLQLAVWQNHLETSRWLVERAGADPLQRNRFGCSVAHWLSQAPRERAGAVILRRSKITATTVFTKPLGRVIWNSADGCEIGDHAGNFAADLAQMAKHFTLATWLRQEMSTAKLSSCRRLGVPETASPEAIREAYLQLVRSHHPDSRHCHDEGEEFSRLHQAYRHLTRDHGCGAQSNPRHEQYGHEGDVEAQTEMQMFKSRLLTVIGEFGEKGLPLSSLRKKYAQVWSGSALPEPKDFGLRKGCGLLEMLRHVAGDVLVVEMQARGQDPVLHVPRAS
ncbi:Ankyrin-3 (ANK-3) (Ankyrin-G) [Durusdinium trenchii]|uniref:Ankyrin-3 (ANK-3) (Ankyrin-G) n=1 Tax=Durusdinium trenchii TaxID=1381693 RepID=A0ABP0PSM6_9DINO